MKRLQLLIWVGSFLFGGVPGLASGATLTASPTPTLTPTITLTATISPTSTLTATATEVFNARVTINHNSFNPIIGQTVEIRNLNSHIDMLTIRVYNQHGVLIAELLKNAAITRGTVPAWDGRNQEREVVASGVYIIVLDGTKTHKRFRVAVIK